MAEGSHEHEFENLSAGKIQYIFQEPACGSMKRKQTVRRWLERYNIEVDDEFFIKWQDTTFNLVKTVRGLDAATPEKIINGLWNAIFMSLYIEYDTSRDFMEQFGKNTAKLKRVVEGLIKVLPGINTPPNK
jgi:hypothetical protein